MNENLKGYYLNKTGDRVKQLLDRQFIVPTLDSIPNSQTNTWQDGEYTVAFRIGELCRVKVNGEWEFYRLHDIVNDLRVWQKANTAEIPDLSNYYTKDQVHREIENAQPDLTTYATKDDVKDAIEAIPPTDLSDYPTKDEVSETVGSAISSIQFPEDESIKNITQEEYDALFEADGLSDKTLYFVSKEDYPVALYIGKILIAQREEGSKGFAYNFPIIF